MTSNGIALEDWLDVLDREYLATFVAEGGAAVKIAVAEERERRTLARRLAERCTERGYFTVRIDAGTCRAHMPQDIFHALASRVDWRLLARRRVLALAARRGYVVDGIDAAAPVVPAIAERSGDLAAQAVLVDLRPSVQNEVLEDSRMARDFRTAMFHLCMAECQDGAAGSAGSVGSVGYGCQPILDWLNGENTRIGPVRPFSLSTPINRTTARYFIESALYWLKAAGCTGTVVLFDTARVTLPRNPRDGARYYTRAMTIDHYELLRQFVDDIDRLTATLLIVATGHDFVDDQAPRGWRLYDALRTRVMDDVRDRDHVNPVAALVRLAAHGAGP